MNARDVTVYERVGRGREVRPAGLKPAVMVDALRGAEAPLFHVTAGRPEFLGGL